MRSLYKFLLFASIIAFLSLSFASSVRADICFGNCLIREPSIMEWGFFANYYYKFVYPYESIEFFKYSWQHIISDLVVNYILNGVVILIFSYVVGIAFQFVSKKKALLKLLILTVLGYISDIIAFALVNTIIVERYAPWHFPKMKVLSPIYLYAYFAVFLIVLILVSLSFYFIYARNFIELTSKKITYSVIFGFISNPIWLVLIDYLRYIN